MTSGVCCVTYLAKLFRSKSNDERNRPSNELQFQVMNVFGVRDGVREASLVPVASPFVRFPPSEEPPTGVKKRFIEVPRFEKSRGFWWLGFLPKFLSPFFRV